MKKQLKTHNSYRIKAGNIKNNNMKKNLITSLITRLVLTLTVIISFSACERYEDYINDYDYSAVYFGSQKPLRTLVAREDKESLDFKIGVVLGGLLENKQDQWVTFEIDTTLFQTVTGASNFKLLPDDWYNFSISENKIIIPKGKFLGDFTISIDKTKFTADPLSLGNKYALPLKIIDSSADSILRGSDIVKGKDYTILVVKYISEFSGTYYVRGEQAELDAQGNVIESTKVTYWHVDWSQNKTRSFVTKSLNECEMTGIGNQESEKVKVTFGTNHEVVLTSVNLQVADQNCSYDTATDTYRFQYKYLKSGKTYRVDEYLKHRNDPEADLRFEEWN